jgi:aryl-alcohol dehydrogenase-like predicted oxidoreductase
MFYKKVDKIKEPLSAVGYGCWGISGGDFWSGTTDENSIKTIQTAIKNGVNFFDVAPVYGFGHAEEILGKSIKGNRSKIFIASKCGLVWDNDRNISNNLSPDSLGREIATSLKRLDVDYIDLYQCHWPDPQTDIKKTMKKLNELKDEGLIKYIGLTNFSIEEAKMAMYFGEISSMQGLYNMLERNPDSYHNIPLEYKTEKEVFPFVKKNGIAFFPYSPLFQGLLTDSFGESHNFDKNDVRNANPKLNGPLFDKYYNKSLKIREIAKELGKPTSQLAINWLVQKDEITSIIAGAQNTEQLLQNIEALTWNIPKEINERLEKVLEE